VSKAEISIVIISYNTQELLQRCLNSVLPQLQENDEVHVIDNASTDSSAAMVRKNFPSVKLFVSGINKGFSYACNIGWRSSKSSYILFTNGDVEIPMGQIEKMRRFISARPDIGVLSPELIGDKGSLQQMTWGWNISLFGEMKQKLFAPKNVDRWPVINRMVEWLQRNERDVEIVAGACMLVRKDMLEKISGFDEDYELYFEDADLCRRSWSAGYRVHFTPNIQVIHGLGQSGKSSPMKIQLVYRQSQITYYRKHHSRFDLAVLKLYILLKFGTNHLFWTDSLFRYFILQILREKKKIHLYLDLQAQRTDGAAA
jgi:GT2 family glycosyltransferase